jgi:signal transduction histidine kinase
LRETQRVNEASDRLSGGAGPGLSITDRVIRAHGGAVDAQNHPEGGLVVELTLLIARPPEQVLIPDHQGP